LLSDRLRIVIAVDVNRRRRQRVVVTLAALVAIGQHIVEQESMPVSDAFGRQHVVIDQSNDGRATAFAIRRACALVRLATRKSGD
jgi:hypothetical protein